MQRFLIFAVFMPFAISFQLLGCIDTLPDLTEVVGAEETIETDGTFARLRNMFPNAILDDDFQTLREVTASKTYLDFLRHAHPTAEPFQTYEEYLQVAPPDAERYLPFLKEWVGNPTAEDVEVLHRMTRVSREANLILFRKDLVLKGLLDLFEKKIGVFTEPSAKAFLERHNLGAEEFPSAFEAFVAETEQADALWLQAQFEEHGVDAGLLWSALRKPALIGEILQNFPSTDLFLKWVAEKAQP